MSDEEKLKRMMSSYKLPTAPAGVSRQVSFRIKRRRRWISIGLRITAIGSAGLIVAGCWALSVWKPAQSFAAMAYDNCGFLFPTSLTGLIWYSAIWVAIGLIIFGATLLVAGGLRTLAE